ncbi:uncharacterized protein LOC129595090 [Paramacrobiotus metropolitanus]|uniref:uncharacterized protein LOC129595090 n=1 Tax=Paramacrobiotus metropolitanus TaxID=2943436 RepID=UPI0024462500|nr:uncharacterized protein LOC129595090 [Paramacrobiotus metropolitanus]
MAFKNFLIGLGLITGAICAVVQPDEESTERNKLETECGNPSAAILQISGPPLTSDLYPFRTDVLSKEECNSYAKIACGDGKYDYCRTDLDWETSKIFKSYYTIGCGAGGDRPSITTYTKNVSQISPNRAVVVELQERNDAMDPIDSDTFEAIRNQVIDLRIRKSVTPQITFKIRNIGNLPNLVNLDIAQGLGLVVKKDDFSNMPTVRMISFSGSTIADLDPYTFTDLPDLLNLALERHVVIGLAALEGQQLSTIQVPKLTKTDLEHIKKLHCDCSSSWLRNHLKRKPYLTDAKKKGEVATVGNYFLPAENWSAWPDNLRVDCSKEIGSKNVAVYDTEFSYQTSCYDLIC